MSTGAELGPDELAGFERAYLDALVNREAAGLALFQLLELSLVREVLVANPAAGAEWSATVPAGAWWELLGVEYTLTTSAVVANRQSVLRTRDADSRTVLRAEQSATQAASLAVAYTATPGLGAVVASTAGNSAPLATPPQILPAAWTVGTLTGNLDAGDAYSNITLQVREWSPGRIVRFFRHLTDDIEAAGGFY